MKQRGSTTLKDKKRKGLVALCALVLLLGTAGILIAYQSTDNDPVLKPGTIYAYSSTGERVIVHDTGNSYLLDQKGHVSISYNNGETTVKTPLTLDLTGSVPGMSENDTGFYISEDKTAIVYGFANGKSPLYVLISDDMGKTWHTYTIEQGMGHDTKFIGFTTRTDGWLVSGGSAGVARAINYVYQTSDGGKTWTELGNPNDLYPEHLTGAGFSSKDIGFLGFRYYLDSGPSIYWTQDRGLSWEKLYISLPEEFDKYKKTPLSPVFNEEKGLFPIQLNNKNTVLGTIYLTSNNYGKTWLYDKRYDDFESDK